MIVAITYECPNCHWHTGHAENCPSWYEQEEETTMTTKRTGYPVIDEILEGIAPRGADDCHFGDHDELPTVQTKEQWHADDKYVMRDGVQIGSFTTAALAAAAVTAHNQYSTLVAQRDRLAGFIRQFADKGCVCFGETCIQRRLTQMCARCRASQLLETINQQGATQ